MARRARPLYIRYEAPVVQDERERSERFRERSPWEPKAPKDMPVAAGRSQSALCHAGHRRIEVTLQTQDALSKAPDRHTVCAFITAV